MTPRFRSLNRLVLFSAFSMSLISYALVSHSIVSAAPQQNKDDSATIVEGKGKLKNWQGSRVEVLLDNGETVFVDLPRDPTATIYRGTAEPEWLQRGMYVRVTAQLTANGLPVEPISSLEVFYPQRASRRWTPEDVQANVPGIYPVISKNGDAENEPGKENSSKRDTETPPNKTSKDGEQAIPSGTAAPVVDAKDYNVVGAIVGMQRGQIIINAGGTRVQFDVAEDLDVSVSWYGLEFSREDDTVMFRGLLVPKSDDHARASKVVIEGSEPLGMRSNAENEKPDPKKTRRRKRR